MNLMALLAALVVASPFSDHMVLQRDRPVAIWGEATPGTEVTVELAGGSRSSVTADAAGAWRVTLPAMPASKEPRTLTVAAGGEKVSFEDVVVGEVWLAAGQSNMELPLWSETPRYRDDHGVTVAQATHLPYVRFGTMPISWKTSEEPRKYTRTKFSWCRAEPENLRGVRRWSAVAFWYARELFLALDVPVGVIGLYQGGTKIALWTPNNADGTTGGLFNEIVAPIRPYTVRGLVWYQGCSDGGTADYGERMHLLYRGWKAAFENPELPIYFVQIPHQGGALPLRQVKFAEEEPRAGMTVINDVANPFDVHPAPKEIVAQRLALFALKRDYGFKDITADPPKAVAAVREGEGVRVRFANAKSLYVYNDDQTLPKGFEIAGADGKFRPAEVLDFTKVTNSAGVVKAKYGGDFTKKPELLLSADGVTEPRRVRYLFDRNLRGSVFSEVNLPLGVFDLEVAAAEPEP